MLKHRLLAMADRGLAIDTETWAIRHGATPPLVCGSAGWLEPGPRVNGVLLDKQTTLETFVAALEDPEQILIGANIAGFDLGVLAVELAKLGIDVLPLIFKAFEESRIYDLQIAEALHAIANGHLGKDPRTGSPLKNPETGKPGSYSLSMCVSLVLGREDAKSNDAWKLRYGELDGIPLDEWSQEAKDYPIDDAINTASVALAQVGHIPRVTHQHNWGNVRVTAEDGTESVASKCLDCGGTSFGAVCQVRRPNRNLHEVGPRTYSAFCLQLGAMWGFKVDQTYVDTIERHMLRRQTPAHLKPFIDAGVLREDGTENQGAIKRLVSSAYGATEPCGRCAGTGKVPSQKQDTLRCPDCKGRCQPWKSGGKIKPPEVASCATCNSTARIPHPVINLVACIGEDYKTKTCDGTGLVLTEGVPRSEKEGVSISRDTLQEGGDDFLMALGDHKEDAKVEGVYIPFLRQARYEDPISGQWIDCALTLKPSPVLDTGRVAYRGAIQQFPRKPGFTDRETDEYIPSLRECIIARPECCFSSEDYKAGELFAHAQSVRWILGYSDLGEALLRNVDPHSALAADVLGVSYEEFLLHKKEKKFKDARQSAKPFNFGRPAGMGAAKIVLAQRKQGPDTPHPNGPAMVEDGSGQLVPGWKGLRFCVLMNGADHCGARKVTTWGRREQRISPTCADCLECAEHLGQVWLKRWRENSPYFNFISDCIDNGMMVTGEALERWPWLKDWFAPDERLGPGEILQHVSGRVRGGLDFCSASNGLFQALLADFTLSAHRRVTRECYDSTYRVPEFAHANSKRSEYAGTQSPLYGSRPIGFFHDELFLEHALSIAHDAATRVSEVMVEEMSFYCPDIAPACEAEPTLMIRWSKSAECRRDANGRLVVWEPKQ